MAQTGISSPLRNEAHTVSYTHLDVYKRQEVDIDHDTAADAFVHFINRGFRSTPTLVFDHGHRKVVLTEPSDEELDGALRS